MLGVKDICISLGVKKEDKIAVTFWSDRPETKFTCTMLGVKDICISLGVKKGRQNSSDFLE